MIKSNYMKLIEIRQKIDSKTNLSVDEKNLLEIIAMRSYKGQPLKVMDAMSLSDVASPATIHRRLDNLEFKGFITRNNISGDIRSKHLIPTKRAILYFQKIDSAIEKVMKK